MLKQGIDAILRDFWRQAYSVQESFIIIVFFIDVKTAAHQCIQATSECVIVLYRAYGESCEVQIDVLAVERELHAE